MNEAPETQAKGETLKATVHVIYHIAFIVNVKRKHKGNTKVSSK